MSQSNFLFLLKVLCAGHDIPMGHLIQRRLIELCELAVGGTRSQFPSSLHIHNPVVFGSRQNISLFFLAWMEIKSTPVSFSTPPRLVSYHGGDGMLFL